MPKKNSPAPDQSRTRVYPQQNAQVPVTAVTDNSLWSSAECEPHDPQSCMLSHDLINKMFVIIAHCDELERRIPSPWCFELTAKIRGQAQNVSEILRSTQCTVECKVPHAAC